MASYLRVSGPVGPPNRLVKNVLGTLPVKCVVMLRQHLGRFPLILEWATRILVFTVPRRKIPLADTPLGIINII